MYKDVVFYEHVFPYQRVQDTNNPNIYDQVLFTKDQSVLSQPLQTSDNSCESYIEVPEEICSRIDQNLNEDHDIEQNYDSDQSVRMSTRIKKSLEYLKDYHCNLNVSNTSSRVKYHLNFVLSYQNLSPSYTSFVCLFLHMLSQTLILKLYNVR